MAITQTQAPPARFCWASKLKWTEGDKSWVAKEQTSAQEDEKIWGKGREKFPSATTRWDFTHTSTCDDAHEDQDRCAFIPLSTEGLPYLMEDSRQKPLGWTSSGRIHFATRENQRLSIFPFILLVVRRIGANELTAAPICSPPRCSSSSGIPSRAHTKPVFWWDSLAKFKCDKQSSFPWNAKFSAAWPCNLQSRTHREALPGLGTCVQLISSWEYAGSWIWSST